MAWKEGGKEERKEGRKEERKEEGKRKERKRKDEGKMSSPLGLGGWRGPSVPGPGTYISRATKGFGGTKILPKSIPLWFYGSLSQSNFSYLRMASPSCGLHQATRVLTYLFTKIKHQKMISKVTRSCLRTFEKEKTAKGSQKKGQSLSFRLTREVPQIHKPLTRSS